MIIETQRLRLRPFRPDEASHLARIANDYDIAKMVGLQFPYPYTKPDAEKWMAIMNARHDSGTPGSFVIARLSDDEMMGCAGLDGHNDGSDNAALGYWLGRDYWGNGYTSEASNALLRLGFERYQLPVIEAAIGTDNPASQSVARKVGMYPFQVYHVPVTQNRRGWTTFQRWRIQQNEWKALPR